MIVVLFDGQEEAAGLEDVGPEAVELEATDCTVVDMLCGTSPPNDMAKVTPSQQLTLPSLPQQYSPFGQGTIVKNLALGSAHWLAT